MEKVDILGVKFSPFDIDMCADYIFNLAQKEGFHYAFTPNSEIVMAADKDGEFKEILNSADILTADGIGIIYASKILKNPIEKRASGYDISLKLLEKMAKTGKSVYLFGASPEVNAVATEKLKEKYPSLIISGNSDGYFDKNKEKKIIEDINSKKPDFLFVCLGSPKQEKWIYENRDKLLAKVAMGLGGCLDVYAGNVKRAPDIFIRLGLEWFYRLITQPKRFFRMLALPQFMIKVLFHKQERKL